MKTLLIIALLAFTGTAEAGYNISVCGTTADRVQKYFAQGANEELARRDALDQCERASGRACVKPLCQKVFQPTTVAELPPKMQKLLKARLARVEAEYRRNLAAVKAARGARKDPRWEYAGVYAVEETKRKNREAEIEKLLEYARQCQSMSGCPARF